MSFSPIHAVNILYGREFRTVNASKLSARSFILRNLCVLFSLSNKDDVERVVMKPEEQLKEFISQRIGQVCNGLL
jgi:hypothetical protein